MSAALSGPGQDTGHVPGPLYARVESIGVSLPATRQSTSELLARVQCETPIPLEEFTGIRNRRVCGDDEDSLGLAVAAAQDCLSRSRYRADEIDIVIFTSISRALCDRPRMSFEPSMAGLVKRAIGARNATHFDVSNACAGMTTGVQIVDRMIKAGVVRNGLVVSGERITPIAVAASAEITDPRHQQVASLTVGDAGAAVVVDVSDSPADRIHHIELLTSAEFSDLCFGMPSETQPGMAMYADNRAMHARERVQLWPRFQKDFLARHGATFASEQYDFIVQHQVSALAIHLFSRCGAQVFGQPMPESLSVVEEFGNTATTSHYLVLHQALKEGRLNGAKVLLVPAASGIVVGFVSATMSSLKVA